MLQITFLQPTIALLSLVPAFQGKGGAMPPMRQLLGSLSFDKTDTDKDKSLSRDEVHKATFAWLDKNNDKSLDVSELVKLPAEKNARQESRENDEERKDKKEREKKGKDAPPMILLGQDGKPGEPGKKGADGKDGEPGKKGADGKRDERTDAKEDAKLTPARQHLDRMDANKDGKIALDEFALPEAWWGSVDMDRDGKISKDEFLGKVKADDSGDGKKKNKGIKLANMTADEAMTELDANKDGRVSSEEWSLNAKLFEKVDADADGSLSKDEVSAAIAAVKQMMKGRAPSDEKGEEDKPAEKKPAGGSDAKKPAPKPGEAPPM